MEGYNQYGTGKLKATSKNVISESAFRVNNILFYFSYFFVF